ncbi:MAG: DUF6472 family protein [Eubacteriales bacterium]|nr:DUF6472 family protein [Eubacteriales bacterium]
MANQCEYCAYYTYDDECEEYFCEVNLDEDDLAGFLAGSRESCPYYRNGDEYAVVRHQL